jgi:putative adenylate-forming enzyme
MNVSTVLPVFALLRTFRAHDRWSHGELKAYQDQSLRALRDHAYHRSPFYQQFHRGWEQAPLHELPVLTKTELMSQFDDLLTDRNLHLEAIRQHLADDGGRTPFLNRYRVVSTSGSSGHPGIFLFDPAGWTTVLASFARAREWAGQPARITRRTKTAVVSSTDPRNMSTLAGMTFQSWWVPTLRLSAIDPLEHVDARLNAWQPQTLVAYASMARTLAEEQRAGRLHIAPQLVLASSEVLTADTRRRLEATWGNVVFDEYAATETGSLAAECRKHCGLHVFEDLILVEVVDQANRPVPPGTFGDKLLVTVFFNRTQPLIRYELTDSVRVAADPCPCGMPYLRFDAIRGRVEEELRLPGAAEGQVTIHPNVFHAVMDAQPVLQWQVIQENGGLHVLIRPDREGFDAERLSHTIRQILEQRGTVAVPVRVEVVAVIPKSPSGKTPLIRAAAHGQDGVDGSPTRQESREVSQLG